MRPQPKHISSEPIRHSAPRSILEKGRNCWRVSPALRTAVLVDAKEYFQSIVWAAERAERSICILSWDIDSRISLIPQNKQEGEFWSERGAQALADFFLSLVEEKPQLEIFILTWDFPIIYADERESKAETKRRFCRHPRIHLEFDKSGPLLVSHHQKVIVVDDQLAFCGGLDITQRRWDTPEHKLHNPFRRDPGGKLYEPFHDVQMMVEGRAARDLGELFRDRWKYRTKENPLPLRDLGWNRQDYWPEFVPALLTHHPVAISRTFPQYKNDQEIRENESLFLDSIQQAKHYIYVENQYLTSKKVGDALISRLQEENPPEIVILVRLHNSKWTEAVSMSVLRSRLLRRIKKYDKKNKLLVLCPHSSVTKQISINLHSKVYIADDTLLRVGSSNLCGRSEGMDTECDLTVEAHTEENKKAIRATRNRLLAEHLGVTEEEVERECASRESFLEAVRELQTRSDRSLVECPDRTNFLFEWIGPSAALVDPESPRQFVSSLWKNFFLLAGLVLFLAFLPQLKTIFTQQNILAWALWIQRQPFAPLGLVALFALLSALPLPLLPIAIGFAILLPPLESFFCLMAGAMLAANIHYFLARFRMRHATSGFFFRLQESERFLQLQRLLDREGVWPIALLRLLPIAPFWLENISLGILGLKYSHFSLATFCGLLPGFIMISFFEDQVSSRGGTASAILSFAFLFVLIGWAIQKGVRHFLERKASYVNSG